MESWTFAFMFVSINVQRFLQGLQAVPEKINYPACVKDKYGFLALTESKINVQYENSATFCTSFCQASGYIFSGTKKRLCICGNNIRTGIEVSSKCESKCPGNGEETCGGEDSVSLRHIGYVKTTTDMSLPMELETSSEIALTTSSQTTTDDFADEYTNIPFTEYTENPLSDFPFTDDVSNTVSIKTDSNNTTEIPKLFRPETSPEINRDSFMEANLTNEFESGLFSIQANNTLVSPKTAQIIPNYPVCVKDLDSLMAPLSDGTKPEVKILFDNSATQCTAHCKELRYLISGTKNYVCVCVNGINHTIDLSATCETNCPGDKEETCGGEDGVLLRRITYTNGSFETKVSLMIAVYISLPVGIIVAGSVILIVSLLFRWYTRSNAKTRVRRYVMHEPGSITIPDDDHYQTISPEISRYLEDLTHTKTEYDSSDAGYITPVESNDTAGYITPVFTNNTVNNCQYNV